MKPLLSSVIAPHQCAFLKGRLISDNIMLATELMDHIHSSREGRRKLAALEIDFSKAFDRFSWNFISAVLFSMGFPMKWINLISQCIFTVEKNLLFNSQIASVFKPSRGVRQGDPLSPYLYILSANVLSCLISHQEALNSWKGVKLCRSAHAISHLLYADDSLIFTEASTEGIKVVQKVLKEYSDLSGQIINTQKSSFIFSPNVPHADKLRLSRILDIPFAGRLGKYLGTWVDPGRNKSLVYHQVLSAIDSRTASWKSKLLSQGSRLTLLKSVLAAVNIKCLNFFWGMDDTSKRMLLSNKNHLFLPLNQGGLGLRPIGLVNKSLLAKQVWSIISADQSSLLAVTLGRKYIDWSTEPWLRKPYNSSWLWNDILECSSFITNNLQ